MEDCSAIKYCHLANNDATQMTVILLNSECCIDVKECHVSKIQIFNVIYHWPAKKRIFLHCCLNRNNAKRQWCKRGSSELKRLDKLKICQWTTKCNSITRYRLHMIMMNRAAFCRLLVQKGSTATDVGLSAWMSLRCFMCRGLHTSSLQWKTPLSLKHRSLIVTVSTCTHRKQRNKHISLLVKSAHSSAGFIIP